MVSAGALFAESVEAPVFVICPVLIAPPFMDDGRIIPDGIHFVRRNPPGGLKVGDGRLSGMGRSVDTFTIQDILVPVVYGNARVRLSCRSKAS